MQTQTRPSKPLNSDNLHPFLNDYFRKDRIFSVSNTAKYKVKGTEIFQMSKILNIVTCDTESLAQCVEMFHNQILYFEYSKKKLDFKLFQKLFSKMFPLFLKRLKKILLQLSADVFFFYLLTMI